MRFLFQFFIVICFLCVSLNALAQQNNVNDLSQGQSNVLNLYTVEDEKFIGPFSYVTKDAERTQNWKSVLSQHFNNIRGVKNNSNLLNLSFSNAPHYFVFSVKNHTNDNAWVMDFGRRIDGRSGLIRSFYLYDATDRKMLVDGFARQNAGKELGKDLLGNVASLDIAKDEVKTFLLYMIVDNGLPASFPISIKSEKSYLSNQSSDLAENYALLVIVLSSLGFFIGLFFIRTRVENFLFVLYFALQSFLFGFLDLTLFSPNPITGNIVAVSLIGTSLLLLLLTRQFLSSGWREGHKFSTILIAATVIFGVFLAYSVAFILPPAVFIRPVLIFGVIALALTLSVLLSLAKLSSGHAGVKYHVLGVIILAIGASISLMSHMGMIEVTKEMANAYWYSLIPHSFLLMVGAAIKYKASQSLLLRKKIRQNQEAESVARLKQSKESADQQRLLRVLEREREVMEELRQREAQRTEEMRKAKEAADEANRAKSAFLAVISHEIRTPMTGVMGMVKLLHETEMDEKQVEYATTIQESGNTMLALLNDILDFEKIETGKMDIENVTFDLHRLIQSVVTLMSGRAKENGIEVQLDVDKNVPKYLNGDPTRLRQILLNLVGNGIKFTSNGSVTVIVQREEGTSDGKVHSVYFAVQDTGIGISDEAQQNLFNPFSQADKSISRKFGGSGLGLAICKRLVEAMGGSIGLKSVEGEGSTFHFTIQMEGADESSLAETDQSLDDKNVTLSNRVLRILVAEDNEINQKVIAGFLNKSNYLLDIVNDGEKAVLRAKSDPYDIILMDIEMPLLKGMDATKQIREEEGPNQQTPIIAMTGNILDSEIQSYKDAGMDGHLAKPINANDLVKAVHEFTAMDEQDKTTEDSEQNEDNSDTKDNSDEVAQSNEMDDAVEELDIPDFSYQEDDDDLMPSQNKNDEKQREPLDTNLFDESMIMGLLESLGDKQLKELIDSLYDKTDDLISQLTLASKNKNFEELHARGHELKGMAGNFGFKKVSHIAKDIEHAAKEQDDAFDFDGTIAQLEPAYKESKESIVDWL